jgi:hypothetical protein
MITRHVAANLFTAALTALALWALLPAVFIEVLAATPLPRQLYAAAGLLILAGGVAVLLTDPSRKRIVTTTAGCLLVVAALATLHGVPWSSSKPFRQRLARVKAGMTESEVRQVMRGYTVGTGWPADPFGDGTPPANLAQTSTGVSRPAIASLAGELAIRDAVVFRHNNDARFNSDWGVVSFRDGRVISVEFMPD